MNIHEYQAKKLFQRYKIRTTRGLTVGSVAKAAEAAQKLGGNKWVIKAQIHSGGRGKAGGVKFAQSIGEVAKGAEEILGKRLFTKQCGPEGKLVKIVTVERASIIKKEFYLSLAIDNENAQLMIIASSEGGTEIEEVAEKNPEKIIKVGIPLSDKIRGYHALYIAQKIGIPKERERDFVQMVDGMYNLFVREDCSLVEINPLIINGDDELVALDAKINFDDSALYRHPDIIKMRDKKEEHPIEVEASKFDLNYIQLDGTIGCMVNGAGLAMATMDIIQAFGGSPANFLDVGGSATAQRVTAAFRILMSDPKIKAIMINIFGGIMKCDVLAAGIVEASKIVKPKVPLIVRFDGTNVEEGRKILADSGLKIYSKEDMAGAARLAVDFANH